MNTKQKALNILKGFLDTMESLNGGKEEINERDFKIFVGGVLATGWVIFGEEFGEDLARAVVQELNNAIKFKK